MTKKLALLCAFAVAVAPASLARAESGGGGDGVMPLTPMPEIAVPIIDGAQMEGVLRLTLVVEGTAQTPVSMLEKAMPRLRSAALGAAIEFARLRASPFQPVDVARLSTMIDAALVHADPAVSRALIVRVMASEA